MYLQKVIISNFKNFLSAEVEFSPHINCICGNNGVGKTNLLDAIYYLSMTKSFLLSSDTHVTTHNENVMTLFGQYEKEGMEERLSLKLQKSGEKILKRNSKTYKKLSEHIGFIPIVVISPKDSSLIYDSAEERRRFVNIILSQTDKEYLHALQNYNKALNQRNKLLKQENPSDLLIESIDVQLVKDAEYIYQRRKELVEVLSKDCEYYYAYLSEGSENIGLIYQSPLNTLSMSEILKKNLSRDKVLGYTSSGVHRDELEFLMNDYSVKKCASQGQQKSFIIALRLAQYSIMRKRYNFSPILLLDDIFDKLDRARVSYLLNLVSTERFGQIFISDTSRERLNGIIDSITDQRKYFTVEGGRIILDAIR